MKGLILAGGVGSRLRPFTYSGPKQLFPIANRPVLLYAVDALVDAGIRDIAVLVSPESHAEIARVVGDGRLWGAKITFIVQDRPAGLAHAVATARAFIGDDAVCVYLGDNLLGAPIRGAVATFVAGTADAAVMLKEVEDPSRFGVAVVDAGGRVTGLVEKPAVPPSKLALIGVYLLRPRIFEAIDHIRPSARGELEITDALMELLARGGTVEFTVTDAWWIDTGKMDDLLRANDAALETWLAPACLGELDASTLIGPVRVEAGARIVRSVVRGPAVIGAGACLTDSTVGPYTSVGAGVVIERSTVVRSIVLEDSHIADVSLTGSLIGRRVVVRPGATASLWVGDDCAVTLPGNER
jgi:glucose-1-phosphate thymidylyltransferase